MCSYCPPEPLDLRVPSKKYKDLNHNRHFKVIDDGSDLIQEGSYSTCSYDSSSDGSSSYQNNLPNLGEFQDSPSESSSVSVRGATKPSTTPSPKLKRKWSSSPRVSPTGDRERKKPGRKPGQVSNVLHLWEFMLNLLHDPSTGEEVIQWISKDEGVFKVVDSAEVARRWGQKKNNKKEMTYEKLSRSLRYSREEGYFDSLPKDKNYPKKLCFKFGPKSSHHSCPSLPH